MISAPTMARAAGCSYRQLDHWVRNGILVPAVGAHGSGTQRRWSAAQVPLVRLVTRLSALGAPATVLRRAVETAGDLDARTFLFVTLDGTVTAPDDFAVAEGYVVDVEAIMPVQRELVA